MYDKMYRFFFQYPFEKETRLIMEQNERYHLFPTDFPLSWYLQDHKLDNIHTVLKDEMLLLHLTLYQPILEDQSFYISYLLDELSSLCALHLGKQSLSGEWDNVQHIMETILGISFRSTCLYPIPPAYIELCQQRGKAYSIEFSEKSLLLMYQHCWTVQHNIQYSSQKHLIQNIVSQIKVPDGLDLFLLCQSFHERIKVSVMTIDTIQLWLQTMMMIYNDTESPMKEYKSFSYDSDETKSYFLKVCRSILKYQENYQWVSTWKKRYQIPIKKMWADEDDDMDFLDSSYK